MKVCLVSRELLPFWGAGIGAYAASMARAFAAAGHETHLLTADHTGLKTKGPALLPGVRLHVYDPIASAHDRERCTLPVHQRAMGVFRTLDRLHLESPFDYIEFPDYFAEGYFAFRARAEQGKFTSDGMNGRGAAVLGVRLHTPTVLARELNLETVRSDEVATLEHMEASAIKDADLVLSPTRSLLEWTRANLELAGDATATVVPYPFDARTLQELDGEGDRGGGGLAPAGADASGQAIRTVLYFGRIEKRKGVENLVDAGRRLVDTGLPVRFVFIGLDTRTGPDGASLVNHLKSRVINMKTGRFVFEAARPRLNLGAAIRAADVVCLPSLWENFPNACVEAMALGACVVGSDKGGMGEIIRDGVDGFLFDGGNTSNLGEVLKRVLSDEPARRAVAGAAPARIRELCDPARVVRGTVHAVERARKSVIARPQESAETLAARTPVLEVPLIRAGRQSEGWGGLLGRLKRVVGR